MNATMAAVLADAGPPPPTGGNFLPLAHYVGWSLLVVSLVGFVAVCTWMVWRREAPKKGVWLALLGTVLYGAAGVVLGSVF